MREVLTQILIERSPDEVWRVLSDLPGWADWNPLIRQIDGRLEPGARVRFRIALGLRALPIDAVVLRVDPARELCWRGPASPALARLMSGEHWYRMRPTDAGHTLFLHGERFEGPLSSALWPALRPRLEDAYAAMNAALKAVCEER